MVKPMPASTCWQCVATVRAVRPADALARAAVVGPGSPPHAKRGQRRRLDAALDEASPALASRAAAEVAERLNVPRKRAYARALERAQ